MHDQKRSTAPKSSWYGAPNPQEGDTKAKSAKRAWMRRKDNETKSLAPSIPSKPQSSRQVRLLETDTVESDAAILPPRQRKRPMFLTYNSFRKHEDRQFDLELAALYHAPPPQLVKKSGSPKEQSPFHVKGSKDLNCILESQPPKPKLPHRHRRPPHYLTYSSFQEKEMENQRIEPLKARHGSGLKGPPRRTSHKRPLNDDNRHTTQDKNLKPTLRVSIPPPSQPLDESHSQNGQCSKLSAPPTPQMAGLVSPSAEGKMNIAFRQRRTDLERLLPVVFLGEGEKLTGEIAAKACGEEVAPEDVPLLPVPEPCAWPYESLELETKESEVKVTKVPQFWRLPLKTTPHSKIKRFKRPRDLIQGKGPNDADYGYDADEQDVQFLSELNLCYGSKDEEAVKKLRNADERCSYLDDELVPLQTWEAVVEALEIECEACKQAYGDRKESLIQEQRLWALMNRQKSPVLDDTILGPEQSIAMPTPPYLDASRMVKLIYSILEQQVWSHKKKIPEGMTTLSEDLYLYWLSRWHCHSLKREDRGTGPPLRRQHYFSLLAWEQPKRQINIISTSTLDLRQTYEWLYHVRIELDWARMILDMVNRREKRKREVARLVGSQVQMIIANQRQMLAEENMQSICS